MSGDYLDIARAAIRSAEDLTTKVRPHTRTSAQIMGGHFEVVVVGGPGSLSEEIITFIRKLEALWSRFLPTSEISEMNNRPGVPVSVSEETLLLVSLLVDGFNLTDGIFDPTTLPVTIANGYSASHIDPSRLTALPESATWPGDVNGIVIDQETSTITLPVGTTLDPGGLGKGLAADLAVDLALEKGASGILVSASGDVHVAGVSPDGHSWRIGVEHPLDKHSEIAQAHIGEGSIVTSSRMTNKWMTDTGETHHIIDPTTGASAKSTVLSATVISAQAALGEVLAKLPFVLPLELAVAKIVANGAQVCIVDENMMMHTSDGWDRYVA